MSPASATPTSTTAIRRYDFESDEVEGTLQHIDGLEVNGEASPARHVSLIEIRASFIAAIAKSVEDL